MYKTLYLTDFKTADEIAGVIFEGYIGVVGFDTETYHEKLNRSPIDVIQIYVPWPDGGICYIFHVTMFKSNELPANLRKIITSKLIAKACSAPENDKKWISQRFKIQLLGDLDIQTLSGITTGEALGLDKLASRHLEDWKVKSQELKMGRWDRPLSDEMKRYAADDAFASYQIAVMLVPTLRPPRPEVLDLKDEDVTNVLSNFDGSREIPTVDLLKALSKLPNFQDWEKPRRQRACRHLFLQLSTSNRIISTGAEKWSLSA